MNIIHRDIKLANILLHFPNNPEIESMNDEEKSEFLKNFDFSEGNF
jgi:serine/threonine protein kinase